MRCGCEVGEEEGGAVGGGAEGVVRCYGGVVAVGVGCAFGGHGWDESGVEAMRWLGLCASGRVVKVVMMGGL